MSEEKHIIASEYAHRMLKHVAKISKRTMITTLETMLEDELQKRGELREEDRRTAPFFDPRSTVQGRDSPSSTGTSARVISTESLRRVAAPIPVVPPPSAPISARR